MIERLCSPATARNRTPILAVLQGVLSERARVLEVASGAGEHAAFFARSMPGVDWQPSDPDPRARESITAWIAEEGLTNVRPPLAIDVRERDWGVAGPYDALVAINMIHISPWGATLGLMRGAGDLLSANGVLFTYGPYKREGSHTSPSNEAFDNSLKSRDPTWGVRDVEDVERAALAQGLALREIVDLPANNLSLVFSRT